MKEDLKIWFTKRLLSWFDQGHRPLPWKGVKNPYLIWVSEIILQQTRVEQGLPYYERFIKAFPTVLALAQADEAKVMRLWQGLGYYSRARNMHKAAKYIVEELSNTFPGTYEEIIQLSGVGPYTAAAIASFAFDEPKAVVDGNVYRVLSRIFSLSIPIDSTEGKKVFRALADDLISIDRAADYNQAIMDFGAIICKPKKPKCDICVFSDRCRAYKEGHALDLPVKSKRVKKVDRYFNYLVLMKRGGAYVKLRVHKDIWRGLYEFPLVESEGVIGIEELRESCRSIGIELNIDGQLVPKYWKRTLSHQRVHVYFWKVDAVFKPKSRKDFNFVPVNELKDLPVPKVIDLYLRDNSLTLFD